MDKKRIGPALGGVVFGLAIAGLGAFFVYVLLQGARRARETRGWAETRCSITRSELEEGRPTPNSPLAYRAVIRYDYSHGGTRYTGGGVKRVDGPTSHKGRAEAVVEEYPVGRELSCWVDPDDPERAVLEHGTMAPLYTVWFPGLFVVAGVGIALTALRNPGR